jgi:hypothetical protein
LTAIRRSAEAKSPDVLKTCCEDRHSVAVRHVKRVDRVAAPEHPDQEADLARPGVLALDIVEGPRAHVTQVRLEGVSDTERPHVERAVDIAPPEPYTAPG